MPLCASRREDPRGAGVARQKLTVVRVHLRWGPQKEGEKVRRRERPIPSFFTPGSVLQRLDLVGEARSPHQTVNSKLRWESGLRSLLPRDGNEGQSPRATLPVSTRPLFPSPVPTQGLGHPQPKRPGGRGCRGVGGSRVGTRLLTECTVRTVDYPCATQTTDLLTSICPTTDPDPFLTFSGPTSGDPLSTPKGLWVQVGSWTGSVETGSLGWRRARADGHPSETCHTLRVRGGTPPVETGLGKATPRTSTTEVGVAGPEVTGTTSSNTGEVRDREWDWSPTS